MRVICRLHAIYQLQYEAKLKEDDQHSTDSIPQNHTIDHCTFKYQLNIN